MPHIARKRRGLLLTEKVHDHHPRGRGRLIWNVRGDYVVLLRMSGVAWRHHREDLPLGVGRDAQMPRDGGERCDGLSEACVELGAVERVGHSFGRDLRSVKASGKDVGMDPLLWGVDECDFVGLIGRQRLAQKLIHLVGVAGGPRGVIYCGVDFRGVNI